MTTQWGAPLTGAQMKLLRAAGLPDETRLDFMGFDCHKPYRLPADHAAYALLEAGWLDGRDVALWFGGDKAPDDVGEGSPILFRDGQEGVAGHGLLWSHDSAQWDIVAYIADTESREDREREVLVFSHKHGNGFYYRPNSQGYTVDINEAGRFPFWEAQEWCASMDYLEIREVPSAKTEHREETVKACQSFDDTVTIAKMTEAEAMKRLEANCFDEMALLRQLGLIREPTREERFWQAQPNGGALATGNLKAWVRKALNFECSD